MLGYVCDVIEQLEGVKRGRSGSEAKMPRKRKTQREKLIELDKLLQIGVRQGWLAVSMEKGREVYMTIPLGDQILRRIQKSLKKVKRKRRRKKRR